METAPDDTKIALIQQDIGYIKQDVSDIKSGMDKRDGLYVTIQQMSAAVQPIDTKIDDLQKAIITMQKDLAMQKVWSWFRTAVLMIATSVVTFLVLNYLQHAR